jgi:hypothetical protein
MNKLKHQNYSNIGMRQLQTFFSFKLIVQLHSEINLKQWKHTHTHNTKYYIQYIISQIDNYAAYNCENCCTGTVSIPKHPYIIAMSQCYSFCVVPKPNTCINLKDQTPTHALSPITCASRGQ